MSSCHHNENEACEVHVIPASPRGPVVRARPNPHEAIHGAIVLPTIAPPSSNWVHPSIILIYNCLTTSIRSMPWTMSAHSARTESPAFYSVLRITESHCMTHSCVEMILGVGKSPPPTLHDSCCWVDFVEWFSMSQKW